MRAGTGYLFTFLFLSFFLLLLIAVSKEIPKVKTVAEVLNEEIHFNDLVLSNNSYMYDRHGRLISEIYGPENRIYIQYDEIPDAVKEAFIATEDRNFFTHKGFDMSGIARALLINVKNSSIEQGGSTISQQLVRNLYLNNERSYNRKLSELLYAFQLEKAYTKDEIIELYINAIYFQNGVYGIEAASRFYFNRPVSQLSLAETAFLAAIPNNPTLYNPLLEKENTRQRQKWILLKMLEMGFIDEKDYTAAKSESISLNVSAKTDLYPDYVSYIFHEFKQLVSEKEGYAVRMRDARTQEEMVEIDRKLSNRVYELLYRKGVKIETALDPDIHSYAIKTMNRHVPEQDIEASIVIINHQNNEITALAGGKNQEKHYFNRAFQAYRQPGSAIKPLLAFAPYIEELNASVNSIVNAADFCKNGYCPRNFGGAQYGRVTLTAALKHSYNTAAVRLLDENGIEKSFSYLETFSFDRITENDYRLPSALGGLTYGVTPLQLTDAYTAFAASGVYTPAKGIRKVTDVNGDLLFEWNDKRVPVWSIETNDKMRFMLNKVITEGTAQRASYPTDSFLGGKTGTTNDFKDLWFIGFNDQYTSGVWIGKDRPGSLSTLNTRSPHLMIWKDIMRYTDSH